MRNEILSQITGIDRPKSAIVHSNSKASSVSQFKSQLPTFYEALKSGNNSKVIPQTSTYTLPSSSTLSTSEPSTFIPGPFSSNYSAMVLKLFEQEGFVDPKVSALLTLTAKLMRSKYLHREIREKGGAYGSAASFSPLSNLFTFSSYRDPTPLQSLQVFKQSAQALLSTSDSPDEQDLLGAKLSVFSDLDAPVNVSSRGLQLFLYGERIGSDQNRQMFRNALRFASLKDIKVIIEEIILPAINDDQKIRTCVIGEEAKISEFRNDCTQKLSILQKKH